MVAYNFKSSFIEPIQSGRKRQTIRHEGKRRHARPGELLQLYTGLRTKAAQKIVADPVCIAISVIAFDIAARRQPVGHVANFYLDGIFLEDLDQLARDDGFANLAQFGRFWSLTHGEGHFEGLLIRWEPR